MIHVRGKLSASLMVAVWLVFANDGFCQVLIGAQTALDNVAAAGARSPGNMVGAGVAQAINFGNRGSAGIVITATAPTTSIRAQAIADSLQILFDQLNQAILIFHNLLLARAGQPPVLPAVGLKTTSREELRPAIAAELDRDRTKVQRLHR